METISLINECENELKDKYKEIEDICFYNSKKVLDAFRNNHVYETHFNCSTGYGYNDLGRDVIESIYADIFKCEDALVRSSFISGTHALTVALFACLRPNDIMLSITGKPYDTLDTVIGFNDNKSSLKAYGVKYEQVDLIDNEFDYDGIKKALTSKKIKLIEIQRSKGYSVRKSITIDKLEKVISFIKGIDKEVIIMIDNCYCEFVSKKEPTEVGADLVVGSLIKNLGAGISLNGAYIVGRKDLVELAADRLNVPGQGKEVGPLNQNRNILQGLYMAPSVVCSSVKVATLTSLALEKLGYKVEPRYNEPRADIVESIFFNDPEKLIKYVRGIQSGCAIDSDALVEPCDMPGYDSQIVMASGSFVQGSSIELSCDGPLRSPYIAYQQGSLTYDYGKLGVIKAIDYLMKE